MENYWLFVCSSLHYQSVRLVFSFFRFDFGHEVFQADTTIDDYESFVFSLKPGCSALPEVPELRIFSSEQGLAYVVDICLTQRY